MNRRDFLTSAAIGTTALALPRGAHLLAQATADRPDNDWRNFEIVTRVEVLQPSGTTRIWLPTPLAHATPFQKTHSNDFNAEGGQAQIIQNKPDNLGILSAEFPAGTKPVVTLTSRVATRNYSVDTTAATESAGAKEPNLEYFLRPTKLSPTDGIVKTTALEITKGASSDVEKARAIYEWIVDNTSRNPKTRGCGLGDIRFMLETKDLSGKCADLNALYVGLARASGLPARDVYGIRVAKSELGYKSLGASSEKITKSQHCRAEVYLKKTGWIPVDPADVRKVILEEPPGNRALTDEMVTKARTRLFGSWEMNWMAYNFAHDLALPGSRGPQLGFLMYPQAETDAGRIDCLDPDAFRYEITSRELTPADRA
jgi:transglutaminase-like putative cysteine protease